MSMRLRLTAETQRSRGGGAEEDNFFSASLR